MTESLSTKKFNNVYVIGDAAHFKTKKGEILPGLAPVAAQQGKFVAKTLKGQDSTIFNYFDKGSMATVSKFKAVLLYGKIQLAGFIAWLAWCFVHILFFIDFRNKLIIFAQWVLTFFFQSVA